jgi:transcriptional regulator
MGNSLTEDAVALLFEEGEVRRHARKATRIYGERRDALAQAVQALGAMVSARLPAGAWRCGWNSKTLLRWRGSRQARSGRHHLCPIGLLPSGPEAPHGLRLGFASHPGRPHGAGGARAGASGPGLIRRGCWSPVDCGSGTFAGPAMVAMPAMDFPSGTPADLARLVADYPLAWLVNSGAHGFFATPLPLVAERTGRRHRRADRPLFAPQRASRRLAGRSARAGAVHGAAGLCLARAGVARSGRPRGISPSRSLPSRWLSMIPDHAGRPPLTDHVEAGQEQPWRIEQAGERLPHLMARIIGFRATVTASDARFKLGQEEDLELLEIWRPCRSGAGWLDAPAQCRPPARTGGATRGNRIAEPGDP